MGEKEKREGAITDHRHHPQYGTFQGVAYYPPPPLPPPLRFPQPAPPSAAGEPSAPPLASFPPHPQQHSYVYQAIPGISDYAVAQGRPLRARPLPCCGIGIGWLLFLVGFFFAGLPWYAAAIVLLCSSIDHREKPGYVACSVAAILLTILIVVLATRDPDDWESLIEVSHG